MGLSKKRYKTSCFLEFDVKKGFSNYDLFLDFHLKFSFFKESEHLNYKNFEPVVPL